MNLDHMLRVYSPDLNLRGACVASTQLCEEARVRHATSPLATVALGRALNGALLMGSSLKGNQRIGLQYRGAGPLKEVYADADGAGNARGYVLHPEADLPLIDGRFDVGNGIGTGILSVTTDLGLRNTYQGVVPLINGEMAIDLAHYLATSAQIPSVVNLGVFINGDGSVGGAGGFLVQTMPGATEENVSELEGNILGLPPLSAMVREGMGPRQIFDKVFHGYTYEVLTSESVHYKCKCSRERVERTLIALGEKELEDMIVANHGAEVKCEFCAEVFVFSEDDLAGLIDRSQAAG